MARIPEQTISRIIETADIIEVISSKIELKKRGLNFWALCPFHDEKTPSFSVSPSKQIYSCFGGCGAKGGVVNFLMQYDKIEFVEAIEKLGKMYNIEIEVDEKTFQSKNLKSQLLEIHEIASSYYKNELQNNKNIQYKDYLKSRNINSEMIDIFEIGCSGNNKQQLLEHLRTKKFSSEAMQKSGLFINGKNGYFETFNSRVIFPIKSPNNEVIGFAGRVLEDKPKMRKFINSFDSPIYYKSKNLYGLNIAKEHINKEKHVFLVEGQWDVVRLYQNGIKNVVGIGGTSLTDLQASIIKQYTSNIFILLDGDQAGIKAAIRSGYTLLKNSINSKIICPPNEFDPDDWLNTKTGKDELLKDKDNASFVIKFHYDTFDHNSNNAINDFIEESINNIIEIKDSIFRELTAKSLADTIKISEENILQTINSKLSFKKNKPMLEDKSLVSKNITDNDKTNLIEDDLIRLCLSNETEARHVIFEHMNKKWLTSNIHQQIFDKIYIHLNSNYEIPIDLIINKTEDDLVRNKIVELYDNKNKFIPCKEMAIDCLIRFEKRILKKEILSLREKIKTSNEENINSIIKELSEIEKDMNELNKKYK